MADVELLFASVRLSISPDHATTAASKISTLDIPAVNSLRLIATVTPLFSPQATTKFPKWTYDSIPCSESETFVGTDICVGLGTEVLETRISILPSRTPASIHPDATVGTIFSIFSIPNDSSG
jgi:hypothetical protein